MVKKYAKVQHIWSQETTLQETVYKISLSWLLSLVDMLRCDYREPPGAPLPKGKTFCSAPICTSMQNFTLISANAAEISVTGQRKWRIKIVKTLAVCGAVTLYTILAKFGVWSDVTWSLYDIQWLLFLPRDAMHKRGYCRHAMSVCPSVCLSVTFVSCAKTNKDIFKIFLPPGS